MNSTMKSRFIAVGMFMTFVLAWLPSQAEGVFDSDGHRPSEYVISNNDTVYAYNTFMYSSLHVERLEDMKSMPLRHDDRMTLNSMLDNTKRRNMRNYPVLADGMFVEVIPKDGSVYGVYVNRSKYTIIAENEQSVLSYYTYTISKDFKEQINAMLSFYNGKQDECCGITRFDSLSMSLTLSRNMCLLNPGRKTVAATFYVVIDTCTVLPMTYYISKRKKGVSVSREIPLWERLIYVGRNEDGTMRVRNSNDMSWNIKEYNDACKAGDILSEYFPSWQNMSNKERMQMLDGYLK